MVVVCGKICVFLRYKKSHGGGGGIVVHFVVVVKCVVKLKHCQIGEKTLGGGPLPSGGY